MKEFTKEEIKALFPIDYTLTNDIIKLGSEDLFDCNNCIGALALKDALLQKLGDVEHVNKLFKDTNYIWACDFGEIRLDDVIITISSYHNNKLIDLMELGQNNIELDEPITISFIVGDRK